jgi:hypothetical protein
MMFIKRVVLPSLVKNMTMYWPLNVVLVEMIIIMFFYVCFKSYNSTCIVIATHVIDTNIGCICYTHIWFKEWNTVHLMYETVTLR